MITWKIAADSSCDLREGLEPFPGLSFSIVPLVFFGKGLTTSFLCDIVYIRYIQFQGGDTFPGLSFSIVPLKIRVGAQEFTDDASLDLAAMKLLEG